MALTYEVARREPENVRKLLESICPDMVFIVWAQNETPIELRDLSNLGIVPERHSFVIAYDYRSRGTRLAVEVISYYLRSADCWFLELLLEEPSDEGREYRMGFMSRKSFDNLLERYEDLVGVIVPVEEIPHV